MEESGTTQTGREHELVEEALAGLAMLLVRGVKASPDPEAAARSAGAGLRALGDWVEQTAGKVAGLTGPGGDAFPEWPQPGKPAAGGVPPAVRQPFLLIDEEPEVAPAETPADAAPEAVMAGTGPLEPAVVEEIPQASPGLSESALAKGVMLPAAETDGAQEPAVPPAEELSEAAGPLDEVPAETVDARIPHPFPLAEVLGGSSTLVTPAAGESVVGSAPQPVAAPVEVTAVAEATATPAAVPDTAVPVLEKLSGPTGPTVSGEWVTPPASVQAPEVPSVRPSSGCVRMLIWLALLAALAWGLRELVQHFFSAFLSA
jgi:hypothetical protein